MGSHAQWNTELGGELGGVPPMLKWLCVSDILYMVQVGEKEWTSRDLFILQNSVQFPSASVEPVLQRKELISFVIKRSGLI